MSNFTSTTLFHTFPDQPNPHSTSKDGRVNKVFIKPSALTPFRARIVDWLCLLTTVAAAIGALFVAMSFEAPKLWHFILTGTLPALAFGLSRCAFDRLLRKSARVVFTPDEFVIDGLFGERRFDRNMPHRFALYPHNRAEREAEIIRFRMSRPQKSWRLFPPKHYLGSSYHLSFEYLDQRNDIMTIYRREIAHQILARLKACDAIMDGYAGKGAGQSLAPEQDWSPQPGDLVMPKRSGG